MNHTFRPAACCVCLKLFFPPINIQHHPVSVPIRRPSDKRSVVTSFETDIIYIHIYIANTTITRYTLYEYVVYSCVLRSSCAHGTWRRGSWHFNSPVCTYLQSITDFLSVSHTIYILPSSWSKRSGRRMPPAKRSALYIIDS